jgi:Rieske Fe-S protein
MASNPHISRRTALIVGAGASAAVVAACSSGSNSSGSATTANAAAGGGPTSEAAGDSPAGGTSLAGGASTPAKSGGDDLGPLSAVPVGQAKAVTLPGGKPGILARPTATTAACFSAICTHMGCTVNADGDKLNCPCHGSQYDALTGKVLRGPAPAPLPGVPVTVTNGQVVTKV